MVDARQFQSGRHFAAWLGLTPKQKSTGGKHRLGKISRESNERLRQLLVLGATAVVRQVKPEHSKGSAWLQALAASAAQACGRSVGQQDGPCGVGHDDAWRGLPPTACRLSRSSSRVKGQPQKMAIGRTDERDTPCHPTAHCDAADVLRARSRNPSGPRSSQPHRKAGHMTALVPVVDSATSPLNPKGRPHMDGRDKPHKPGHDGDESRLNAGWNNTSSRNP